MKLPSLVLVNTHWHQLKLEPRASYISALYFLSVVVLSDNHVHSYIIISFLTTECGGEIQGPYMFVLGLSARSIRS